MVYVHVVQGFISFFGPLLQLNFVLLFFYLKGLVINDHGSLTFPVFKGTMEQPSYALVCLPQ